MSAVKSVRENDVCLKQNLVPAPRIWLLCEVVIKSYDMFAVDLPSVISYLCM